MTYFMKVRESLSELSELLERGERQGIFSSRMPPTIERAIREDNLRQVQSRDACEKKVRKNRSKQAASAGEGIGAGRVADPDPHGSA